MIDETEIEPGAVGYFCGETERLVPLAPAILFNGRYGFKEPDWTPFDSAEVLCVYQFEDADGDSQCEGYTTEDEVDAAITKYGGTKFWSVYGHYTPTDTHGGLDCITDCATSDLAFAIAKLFDLFILDAHARGAA